MSLPSLDGRHFTDVSSERSGDVGADTVFEYHQENDLIWARYAGGVIRLGHLVGTRQGDRLECHEDWTWDSQIGSGTSTIREIRRPVPPSALLAEISSNRQPAADMALPDCGHR